MCKTIVFKSEPESTRYYSYWISRVWKDNFTQQDSQRGARKKNRRDRK